MTERSPRLARSFGTVAENYDRFRPTYATEAVVWALGDRSLRVADLGAGTGILSRLLQRLGHGVVAIEPDDRMRERLMAVSPGVAALAGTAERIPLPDGSVDAVVAGQAYHWFDPALAHPEIARVLRPGGVVATFWNDADPATPWTVRYTEIIDGPAASRPEPHFGQDFGPATMREFRHEIWMSPHDMVGMAMTRSPYLVAAAPERSRILGEIRRLIDTLAVGDRGLVAMPHLTRVYRAVRRSGYRTPRVRN